MQRKEDRLICFSIYPFQKDDTLYLLLDVETGGESRISGTQEAAGWLGHLMVFDGCSPQIPLDRSKIIRIYFDYFGSGLICYFF